MAQRQEVRVNKYNVLRWLIEFHEKKLKKNKKLFFTREEFIVWVYYNVSRDVSFESIIVRLRELARKKVLLPYKDKEIALNKNLKVARKKWFLDVYMARRLLSRYEKRRIKKQAREEAKKGLETIARFFDI